MIRTVLQRLALCLSLAAGMHAGSILYTFRGSASGTIGGVPFNNASFTMGGVGNPANITFISDSRLPFLNLEPGSGFVEIGGLGQFSLNGTSRLQGNAINGQISFVLSTCCVALQYASTFGQTFDLTDLTGPISFAGPNLAIAFFQGMATSGGSLSVAATNGFAYEAVPAPEPATLALLVPAVILMARRHRS